MNFDLFYSEKGWPWHYDRVDERFKTPIGSHWKLIVENCDNEKLNLFTNYYAPLKVDFEKTKRSVSRIIKLWKEFEIFQRAIELKENGILLDFKNNG